MRSDAIFTVANINYSQYRRHATIKVDDQPINFQVDSASDLTVINEETWQLVGKPELQPSSLIAHSASGDRIQLLEQRQCTYSFHDASAKALEGSKSPAELCFGRKLRTPLSLLKPNIRNKSDINTTMERQFNRHHGARRKTFKRGDSVLVKTYQGQRNWTNGQVLRCLGRVLYGVRIGEETWIRHANQLRMRFSEEGHNRPNDMDTLFEMFELERPHSSTHYSTTPQDNAVESTSTTLSVQDVPQLRRSTRTRRAPLHFVVNPSQRSYRSTGTNS
ncbi:hypothetical protein ANCCEY_07890 [Ancylostoma ceylanicum]|uniref:Peptidase A2 domain-containing protein n=1 Tax=Ancylostoma ceylanicum TaxID=53326 RepID=A0A0D6LSM3_9BILA|nr:hypothetical protein ANCCEY_07890 [Ancylostoma ceylanicum]